MQGPIAAPQMAEGIGREIHRLADAHARQPREQQSVGEQIVTAVQFALQTGVVFRCQRTWQHLIEARDIFTQQQTGPRRESVIRQQVEQLAQTNQMRAARLVTAWFSGNPCAPQPQMFQPAEDMRIAPQIGGPPDLGKRGAQIRQEQTDGLRILTRGGRPQRGGQQPHARLQRFFQRVGRTFHGSFGGAAWAMRSTARAYSAKTSWGVR